MTPFEALLTLVVPAVLVGSTLLAAFLITKGKAKGQEPRPAPGLLGRLAPPLIFALAFWPADIALNQWHDIWPTDGTQRFLAVAIGAGVIGVAHAVRPRATVTVALRLVLGALLALGLLSPVSEQYMPPLTLIVLAAATGLWLPLAGAALDRADRTLDRTAIPGALTVTALAAAPGIFQSGYAGGARLAAALGAVVCALFLVSVLRARAWALLEGATSVWLALLGAVLLVTYGYADGPAPWALPLIALAPLGALAGVPLRRGWQQTLAAAIASGAIAGGATLAVLTAIPDNAGESGYGY